MNSHIFCSHNIISSLLKQFGLVIEYGKSKFFYFSRLCSLFDLLPLKISYFGGSILNPRKPENILASYFIGNYLFNNMSNSTPIKFYIWSNIWSYLGILLKVSFLIRNTPYIGHAYYLLHYIASLYSTTTMYYSYIHLRGLKNIV